MAKLSYRGAVCPVSIPRVTLVFDSHQPPYYSKDKPHNGVDLASWAGSLGDPVVSAWTSSVVGVGFHETAGNFVITRQTFPFPVSAHIHGGIVTEIPANTILDAHYYHLKEKSFVKIGETLRAGERLGYVGSTGKSSGPHLHFEVRVNGAKEARVNPLDLLIATIPGLKQEIVYAAGSG